MMLWNGIGLFVLGLIIGWLLRRASTDDRLGRLDITAQANAEEFCATMHETDAALQSAEADTDLDILLCLGADGVSEAKALLIHKLGLFYQQWTSEPRIKFESDCIQKTLFRIREAAKECKLLQDAISEAKQ